MRWRCLLAVAAIAAFFVQGPAVLAQKLADDPRFGAVWRKSQMLRDQPSKVSLPNDSSSSTINNASEFVVKAKQAIGRQDFNEATSWYLRAADLGDVSSMFEIGQIYSGVYGFNDVLKNAHGDEAEHWYEQAANLGSAEAMYSLGFIYFNRGMRDKTQLDKSVHLFQKSANLGYAPSITQLGVMYGSDGSFGVPKNDVKAAQLFLTAAQSGNVQAMNNLGVMYNEGRGVSQDHAEAVRWWKKAVEAGGPDAQSAQTWLDLDNGKPLFPFDPPEFIKEDPRFKNDPRLEKIWKKPYTNGD